MREVPEKPREAVVSRATRAISEQGDLQQTLAVVEAATELHRIAGAVDAALQADCDLDIRCYTVLRLIKAGKRYPSQIAEAMHLPRSSITRALHLLTGQGRIVRALDVEDTRRTRLALTAGGEAAYRRANQSLSEWMAPRLARIAGADLGGFLRAVDTITAD